MRLVNVKNGMLLGMVGKDPRITVFRGIPYARPPIGDLRWRAPQPPESWDGVRKCFEYGPMAMMPSHPGYYHPQVRPDVSDFGPGRDNFYTRELHPTAADYEMSEDCLYLNVCTPARSPQENLPVFCYLHGGGLTDGYSYEVEFDPERMARHGMITVMIGYRLGPFGFLAHPELTAELAGKEPVSNFGFLDQSMALHWVKENIAAFGGDPERITICGQSAGASGVQAQICSPLNEGLITGAIIQSAVYLAFGDEPDPFCGAIPLEESEALGELFFREARIGSLEEARSIPAEELMRRYAAIRSRMRLMFTQCVDGIFVREPVWKSYYNERLPRIPILVGYCFGESQNRIFGAYPLTVKELKDRAGAYGERADEYLALISKVQNDTEASRLTRGCELGFFPAATRAFYELRAMQGNPVYHYIFDGPLPGDDAGTFHGSELWYMFDSLGNSWRPFEGKHYDLARQMSSYWTNFVRNGDPNGKDMIGKDLPRWDPYLQERKSIMWFKDWPVQETVPPNPLLEFRLSYGMSIYREEKGE